MQHCVCVSMFFKDAYVSQCSKIPECKCVNSSFHLHINFFDIAWLANLFILHDHHLGPIMGSTAQIHYHCVINSIIHIKGGFSNCFSSSFVKCYCLETLEQHPRSHHMCTTSMQMHQELEQAAKSIQFYIVSN